MLGLPPYISSKHKNLYISIAFILFNIIFNVIFIGLGLILGLKASITHGGNYDEGWDGIFFNFNEFDFFILLYSPRF